MRQQLSTLDLTRRAFMKTSLSAAGVAGIAASPYLSSAVQRAPLLSLAATTVPAHAQSVVQHLGMNIQPGGVNEYANFDKVGALLQDLGVRKIRTVVRTNDPNKVMPYLASLHTSLGITVHGTAGSFPLNDTQRSAMPAMRTAMAAKITQYADIFNGIGGYNEPNGTRFGPRPSWWLDETLTHQKWMWNLVHGSTANPALAQIEVCGPSLHDQVKTLQQDYLDCSVLKPYLDRINMHRYPAGSLPSTLIDARTAWATTGLGVMPVVISETAYNNGMNSDCYAPVPADVIALYADRLLMEHVSRGNDMYWFEMLNNYPPNSTSLQDFYGLVAIPDPDPTTWQPMPGYFTFKRLLALMQDGDQPYVPAPLAFTASGPTDLRTYLVGKRDGSYVLAVWRDVSLWDRKTRTRLNPSATNVSVTFTSPKTVTTYQPSVGDTALSTALATTHSLSLAGNLTILQIAA